MRESTTINRIERLAKHVHDLKPRRWDFSIWVGRGWKGMPDLSCGTTACAMGHATSMPYFRRLKLRMDRDGGVPYAGVYYGARAAEVIFGLSCNEAANLFVPCSFVADHRLKPSATNKQWARHARRFIKDIRAGRRHEWDIDDTERKA